MKKFAFALAVLSVSVGASATELSAGRNIVPNTTAGCALLVEGVALTLSKDVAGAYSCNTTNNTIAITTCHPNGRKATDGTSNYFYTASSAGGSIEDAQDAACTAGAANTKAVTKSGEVVESAQSQDETPTEEPAA